MAKWKGCRIIRVIDFTHFLKRVLRKELVLCAPDEEDFRGWIFQLAPFSEHLLQVLAGSTVAGRIDCHC